MPGGFNPGNYGRPGDSLGGVTSPSGLGGVIPIPDAGDIDYDNSGSGLTADDVQEAIDELATGATPTNLLTAIDGEGHVIASVPISGASHTHDLADGNILDITLTANCALSFAGIDAGRARVWWVIKRQDATGSRTLTLPGSVVWPGGVAPTLSTAAGSVDILRFISVDGGTVIFGESGGSGAIVADLDDLTDVVITAPALDDDLRYNGSTWVNDDRKWEAVTDGEDIFVWESDDLVHDWST
jgi:hypothetical protein